jgi:phosphatidylglycerol---prolipoprotein diacylglyceryl transferase
VILSLLQPAAVVAEIGWKVLDRFHLGGSFAISPHGVGIAVGYLAGAYVLMFEARRRGIPEDKTSAMVFWALIGAIVGARVFYVIGHFSEFNGIGDMLAVYRGGISLVGGIFGAVIFAYPIMRRHRLGFLRTMDTAAVGLPLGIVIGRIGDLIIGDHLGKPTSWLLAFRYHGGTLSGYLCAREGCSIALPGGLVQRITTSGAELCKGSTAPCGPLQTVAQGVGVHQTALYDFLSSMLLVTVVLLLALKPRRTGILFLTFATWYAGGRVITDFLRVDKHFFGLTGSQWASIGVIVACVATLAWFALHPDGPKKAEPVPDEVPAGD